MSTEDTVLDDDDGCCADDEPQGQIIERPSCFHQSCDVRWQLINGRPKASLIYDDLGGVECGPNGIRLKIGEAEEGCENPLSVNEDGEAVFTPYPFNVCECATQPSCASGLAGGDVDEPFTGCAPEVCVTWKNTHCAYSVKVIPRITIRGAEITNGPITYQVQPTINGNPAQDQLTIFTSPPGATGSYSGSIDMDPITVGPGETLRWCFKPKVRYRDQVASGGKVTWGDLSVCLHGTANAETGTTTTGSTA